VFAKYFYGIWRDRYVLTSLVNKDLQMKYRRAKIGIAWSILTPLGLVLIIGSVYSIIFGVNPKVFIPMLFAD
jgi:ABC-type polysaccharide/polyol phosphate export permease